MDVEVKKDSEFEYMKSTHSSNSIFHFFPERRFLKEALIKKRLAPRYCVENIEYLNLSLDRKMDNIGVLGKCFCDIPLQNINKKTQVNIFDKYDHSDEYIEKIEKRGLSHVDLYGGYAISFSKNFALKNGMEPVHYINNKSENVGVLKAYLETIFNSDEVEESIALHGLELLATIKPIFGKMRRNICGETCIIQKNFHDEQEWRFIPKYESVRQKRLDLIINDEDLMFHEKRVSDNINTEEYEELCFKFDYSDISHIVVPSYAERKKIIEIIRNEIEVLSEKDLNECDVLISKIEVLEDIGEDW